MEFLLELLPKARSEMYEIFAEYFKIEQNMSNHQDKCNPLRRLTAMQEALILLLNRRSMEQKGSESFSQQTWVYDQTA